MIDALLGMRWLGKAVRVAIAAVLVAIVADLLAAGTNQFSWGTSDESLSASVDKNARQLIPGDIVLTIGVKKQRLTADYRVVLPRTEPLFEAVQRGEAAADTRGLLALLGRVQVAGNPLAFRTPSVAVDEGVLSQGTITIQAEPVTLVDERSRVEVRPPESPCCLPPPRMVVETSGAKVLPDVGSAPLAQSDEQTEFSGTGVSFELLLDPSVGPGKAPAPAATSAAPSLPVSPDLTDRWRSLVSATRLLPGAASLTLRVSKQVLTATYELTLDREQGLLADIQNGRATDRTPELVDLFGRIQVNDKPLNFDPPSVSIDQDQPQGRVTVRSVPLPLVHPWALVELAEPTDPDCCRAGRSVVVETAGAQVQSPFPRPEAQSEERTVFGSVVGRRLTFEVVLTPFNADLTERQQVASLLRDLSQRPIPALGWALYWAVMSLPLLLFLVWRRRGNLADPPHLYATVTETLLAFLLVMLAGSALAQLPFLIPTALWLAQGLHRAKLWAGDAPIPGAVGGGVLMLLAAGFVWPLVAWQRDRTTALLAGPPPPSAGMDARRRRLAPLGAGLLAMTPLICASLVVAGAYMATPADDRYLAAPEEVAVRSGAAALAVVGLLLWICRELGVKPHAAMVTAAAAMVVTLAVFQNVPDETWYSRTVDRVVVTVVCFALAASLLRVAVRIAARPLPEDTPAAGLRTRVPAWVRSLGRTADQAIGGVRGNGVDLRSVWLARLGLGLLLLLLVLPNPRWSGQQFEVVNAWYAQELADWLIHAVYLALGVIVVLCLSDLALQTDQPASKPAARYLCFLLLAMYVFDPNGRIFYLPVTLAAGWLTFSWLLPKAQATLVDSLRGIPGQELIQAAVVAGRERRAYRARRKDLLAKVGSGDITRAEYRQALDVMSRPSEAARVRDRSASEVGMLLGPRRSPWSNGVLLARYSLWISLPWVLAVYLREELSGALQNREFLLAALLLPLVSHVLQWPVIGFVFGYLYPYIRGANGLWKGLSVAAALIVPWLLLNLAHGLLGDNDSWRTFLYWALQVFAACVTTGFLADWAALRRHGRGWDELTDVHNFSALAAWGSSVVAASAAGLITLLQTTIGEFVSQYTSGAGTGPAGR